MQWIRNSKIFIHCSKTNFQTWRLKSTHGCMQAGVTWQSLLQETLSAENTDWTRVCQSSNENTTQNLGDIISVSWAHFNIGTDEGSLISRWTRTGRSWRRARSMQDGRGSATSLSGRGSLLEAEKSLSKLVFSLYTNRAGRKWWRWLWWVISSRGKPRSQWVWPTAVHLEPKRLGEDLLGERHRRSWVRGGFLIVPNAFCLRTPPQRRSTGDKPTCSGFKLTPDIWPHVSLWTFNNMSSESPPMTETFHLQTEQHFRFDHNEADFLCRILSTATITKHYKVPAMQRRVRDTHEDEGRVHELVAAGMCGAEAAVPSADYTGGQKVFLTMWTDAKLCEDLEKTWTQ